MYINNCKIAGISAYNRGLSYRCLKTKNYVNIHCAHEIEITLDGVDGFKIILADTEQCQVALDDIGMLYAMAERNCCIQFSFQVGVLLYGHRLLQVLKATLLTVQPVQSDSRQDLQRMRSLRLRLPAV